MKIIAGARRGLTLAAPKGVETRPTAARTRAAIFNRLDHAFAGADGRPPYADRLVVDACCGAGALALEALSRGAAEAALIDDSPAALAAARRNADA
ncbi:MAG: RsmD family RNA methyltransferase, partial [Pseudomonadota bacterium]